jgi:hypothetical protein
MKDYGHTEFVIYCIETYKAEKNLPGAQAYGLLDSAGALDYIDECYEALHTFGDKEIVRNIEEYLGNKTEG